MGESPTGSTTLMDFKNKEHEFLYDAAWKQLELHPGSYLLEIGSFKGESTRVLAAVAKYFHTFVVAIDPFYGHYDENLMQILKKDCLGESSWVQFCRTLGDLRDFVIPIATTRDKAEYLFSAMRKELFCFAFIDGDHSVQGFVEDLEFCRMNIKEGVIICHDANWPDLGNAAMEFAVKYGYPITFELGKPLEGPFCQLSIGSDATAR